MTLVLGIDPGLSKPNPCGLAIVQIDPLTLVYADAFVPPGATWEARVAAVAGRVQALVVEHRPDLLAWELPATLGNYWTAVQLAAVGGAVAAVGALYGVPGVGVNPTQCKIALAGNVHADKTMMIAAVRQAFGVELTKDAADAVGVSLAGESLWRRAALVRENGR